MTKRKKISLIGGGNIGGTLAFMIANKGIADVVIFDPETIIDCATFEDPHQYPKGIPHVIVNGQSVIQNGKHTGSRPGKVLRRGDT